MIADRLGEDGRGARVGLQDRNDIDPVDRVQVVEMDDVVLDKGLGAGCQMARLMRSYS